jgi:hypothetical protein
MYNLNLHAEDSTRMFDYLKYYDDTSAPNSDSDDDDAEEDSQMVYLSKVEGAATGTFSALWDSGATNTVIGRGPQATRLLDGYVVIHNDKKEGWVDPSYMQTKEPHPKERTKRKIIVASGEAVTGYSVDTLDLGMKARTLVNGRWSEPDRTVFIATQEANVSSNIPTTVFSEGHFMKNNPDWTLITKGKEKYLVRALVKIQYEPIDGELPLRIDLRDSKGGHYLDIISAVTDPYLVKGKDDVEMDFKDSTNQYSQSGAAHMRAVEVKEDRTQADASTSTDETVSYTEEARRRQSKRQRNAQTYTRVQTVECECPESDCKQDTMDVCELLRLAQQVTEDPNSTAEQRLGSIRNFEQSMKELQRQASFMEHRKKDAIQVLAMETRQSRNAMKGQENVNASVKGQRPHELSRTSTEEGAEEGQVNRSQQPVASAATKAVDQDRQVPTPVAQVSETSHGSESANQGEPESDRAYEEYDRYHKASEDHKRRVRFQDQMEESKIFERARAETSLRKEEERKKEKAKKKDVSEDGIEDAAAAAKRKKDMQTEKEKEEMSDTTRFDKYLKRTNEGVQVRSEDKYAQDNTIDKVNDFALGVFLMENHVTL